MDWSLLVNNGVGPVVVVILVLTKTLVPGWLFKKSEETNDLLRERVQVLTETNSELTSQVAGFNQVMGALKAEAQYRQKQHGEDIGAPDDNPILGS